MDVLSTAKTTAATHKLHSFVPLPLNAKAFAAYLYTAPPTPWQGPVPLCCPSHTMAGTCACLVAINIAWILAYQKMPYCIFTIYDVHFFFANDCTLQYLFKQTSYLSITNLLPYWHHLVCQVCREGQFHAYMYMICLLLHMYAILNVL